MTTEQVSIAISVPVASLNRWAQAGVIIIDRFIGRGRGRQHTLVDIGAFIIAKHFRRTKKAIRYMLEASAGYRKHLRDGTWPEYSIRFAVRGDISPTFIRSSAKGVRIDSNGVLYVQVPLKMIHEKAMEIYERTL